MSLRQVLKETQATTGNVFFFVRVNIYCAIYFVLLATHYLIFWPGESSVTTVPVKQIVEPKCPSLLPLGTFCKVKTNGKAVYEGKVASYGMTKSVECFPGY